MNIASLVQAGLNLIRTTIPAATRVGAVVADARNAVQSGVAFLEELKGHAPPESQAEIDQQLTDLRALRDRVMQHAGETIDSLGDG